MGKILLNGNRWKKEKGITLIEIIVSLAIIVIISVAAVSIAAYSSTLFNSMNVKRFFQREIDNIAELYLSYEKEDFSSAFNKLTGKTISGYTNSTYYVSPNFEYVESTDNYSYKINLTFDEPTLIISSLKSDDSVIRTRSVTR